MDKINIKHNGIVKSETTKLLNKIITLIGYNSKPTPTETEILKIVKKYLTKRTV